MSEKVFPYREADEIVETEKSREDLLRYLQYSILSDLESISENMEDRYMANSINDVNIAMTALFEYLIQKELEE